MTKWKLESLLVENFRSISGRHNVPLDADIVLVHGSNGAGKTSLLSALELGATGSVAHLDASTQLINRNYPMGRVELGLRNERATRLSQIEIGPGPKSGEGALVGKERVDFLERCFLPQTVLGRLLESYATKDRADSALVRFVKDLAGINDLDSLITGLHSAGHLSRTRTLSPSWARLEDDISASAAEIERKRAAIGLSQRKLDEALGVLREMVPHLAADGQSLEDVVALARAAILDSDSAFSRLAFLESLRVRLAGILLTLASLDSRQPEANDVDLTVRSLGARRDFEAWEASAGGEVLRSLNILRSRLNEPAVGSGQIFESFVETKQLIGYLATRERRAQELEATRLGEEAAREASLSALHKELAQLQTLRSRLKIHPDTRLLIDLLSAVVPLISSDICPVCDQPFPDGHEAFLGHVEHKTAALSEEAGRYQRLTTQIDLVRDRIASVATSAQPVSELPIQTQPTAADLVRQLNSLETEVDRGQSLRRTMDASLARLADISAFRATTAAAEESLRELFAESESARGAKDVYEAAKLLDERLMERQQTTQFRVTAAERTRSSLAILDTEQRNFNALNQDFVGAQKNLKQLRARMAHGRRHKTAANDLRLEAERVRASLISDVFDRALNESWADFFCRLVPNEPFVPQFRKHIEDSRAIDVVLETIDPGGEPFGSPSSVLSFGNANTAALALFLALHVSAPTSVDWLIFDDPVQSMDEIHIANFAALVRQLTVDHDRQVVIALHQRELFEYLAFELAPASPSDQLLKIELDRRGGASQIEWERLTFLADEAISSA